MKFCGTISLTTLGVLPKFGDLFFRDSNGVDPMEAKKENVLWLSTFCDWHVGHLDFQPGKDKDESSPFMEERGGMLGGRRRVEILDLLLGST